MKTRKRRIIFSGNKSNSIVYNLHIPDLFENVIFIFKFTPQSIRSILMSLGKVAVALSGGGALGLAHVGALKALEEFNVKPAFLSGTSAGSIIGAFYARGLSISEIEDIVLSIDRKKTFSLLSPSIPQGGLIDPKNFVSFMENIIGKDTLIEDLKFLLWRSQWISATVISYTSTVVV